MTNAILSLMLLTSLSTASWGRDYGDLFEFWDDIDAFTAQSFADWRVTRRVRQAKEGDYYLESGAKRLVIAMALKSFPAEAEASVNQAIQLGRKRPGSQPALRVGDVAHSWRTRNGGGVVVFCRASLVVEVTSTEWADVERIARRIDETELRVAASAFGSRNTRARIPNPGIAGF